MAATASKKSGPDIDSASFFNRSTWSDVKIVFGTQEAPREFLCHRLILSAKSDYFATLLKPDSAFKEANSREVRLEEDDPDALEAVLRYIYNFDYDALSSCVTQTEKALFHLKVYTCAQKYLVAALVAKAPLKFHEALHGTTEPIEIMSLVQKLSTMEQLDILEGVVERMTRKHLNVLLDLEGFMEWLGTQPKLNRMLLRGAVAFENLHLHRHAICTKCTKRTPSTTGWVKLLQISGGQEYEFSGHADG